MSDPKSTIPSRLARQVAQGAGPLRGVGSGYAQNQRVAGAQDPEMAAQMATLDPARMQEMAEQMERENAELEEMREELVQALSASSWKPARDAKAGDTTTDEQYIRGLDPGNLRKEHKAWLDRVEKGTEEEGTQALDNPFALTPDHPAYQPIMDVGRRKAIEKGLPAMDFGEIIFKGYSEQKVEIRQGFPVVFRSISTTHGLWLEQRANGESSYDRHVFSLQQLAVGLHTAGEKALGVDIAALTDDKEAFYAEVDKRMKTIGKWPLEFSSDLIVHYIWFTGRVRKLLHGNLMERVGN